MIEIPPYKTTTFSRACSPAAQASFAAVFVTENDADETQDSIAQEEDG
jgi:hypothetical protein